MPEMRAQVPSVVSTFAGCGGSSLGYTLAGFKVRLAVEWDKNAVVTYRSNFPETPIYEGDISELSVERCLLLAGLVPGELDILDGSPPCQGFSTAGKRDYGDNRNRLFREYVRLLIGLKPKAFVVENVSGMAKGKMCLIFAEFLQELKAAGYRVRARVLNAMYFNVPQYRTRLIFVGIRNDLRIDPTFPQPSKRLIPVRKAIGHLPVGVSGNHAPQVIDAWRRSSPGQSLREVVSCVDSLQCCRLDPDKPSAIQMATHLNWHYLVPRRLTIQEAAILHSYPEDYKWPGNKTTTKTLIGNSVPPNFMRAIAEHIRDTVFAEKAEHVPATS